jgi:hypothetical protein
MLAALALASGFLRISRIGASQRFSSGLSTHRAACAAPLESPGRLRGTDLIRGNRLQGAYRGGNPAATRSRLSRSRAGG